MVYNTLPTAMAFGSTFDFWGNRPASVLRGEEGGGLKRTYEVLNILVIK